MSVASKAESQEICFVAQNDYRGFINRYGNAMAANTIAAQEPVAATAGGTTVLLTNAKPLITLPKPGPIYDLHGKMLGRHRGLAFYTIGQRKGLGITSREPLHVLKIDAAQNALIVGPAPELEKTSFTVGKMHYLSGDIPTEPFEARVRVRYKAPEETALVTPLGGKRVHVILARPQRAITPGQAAVFYSDEDDDEVLCGGIIEE